MHSRRLNLCSAWLSGSEWSFRPLRSPFFDLARSWKLLPPSLTHSCVFEAGEHPHTHTITDIFLFCIHDKKPSPWISKVLLEEHVGMTPPRSVSLTHWMWLLQDAERTLSLNFSRVRLSPSQVKRSSAQIFLTDPFVPPRSCMHAGGPSWP